MGYGCIEAPRGDTTHVVELRAGEENIYWWKLRAPTYASAQAWPLMFIGNDLGDAPLIINSIDPCISCMERVIITDRATGKGSQITKEQLLKLCREKTRRMRTQC